MVAPEQLSVPTGGTNVTGALHKPTVLLTEMLAGQTITGTSLSTTVTVNEQEDVKPAASVT